MEGNPMKKYVLHPGFVSSAFDSDEHFVSSDHLVKLYGVSMADCVIDTEPEFTTWDESMVHLYPRYDGNYSLDAVVSR